MYWYEPTVLVDVNHDMACMREETFGPTLPIMKVADAEEAIRLANDSEYGLCAAVFSRDLAHAEAVARRVNSGAVTVNDALLNYTALELPMGVAKPGSGVGYRHGPGGIRKYCRQQALLISRFHARRDVHMLPVLGAANPDPRPPGRASVSGSSGNRQLGCVERYYGVTMLKSGLGLSSTLTRDCRACGSPLISTPGEV
ncbi:aldehyde dehydrogenase family protein [Mycobacterium ulcerans]|uniref:aldehyde dehydrogenase family protein n=1 Tax=Mycobacterium ulcerans TaxID=1809 RepID=UPI00214BBE76|nr:aldehyde dehydrogenase family protein [Mycobacterium ulcerans]